MIEILLIEDNESDIFLLKRALAHAKLRNDLNTVTDGDEALRYLFKKEPFQDSIRPDLILLDLNLPKIDGREVLSVIKSDPGLKSIPVIVFTSSSAEKDIIETYNLHANSFVTKPVDYNEFILAIRKIEDFWFDIVKYAPRQHASERDG